METVFRYLNDFLHKGNSECLRKLRQMLEVPEESSSI